MSDKPETTLAAPHVSNVEKETEKVPSVTTKNIEKTSSKENSSDTIPKRRKKRTSEQILEEIRNEKKEETKEEVKTPPPTSPPPQKRVKVTTSEDEDFDEELPSFWKGVIAKPLLLAGLGGLTFFVSHWFKTTTKTTPKPQYQHAKPQKHVQSAAAWKPQPAAPPPSFSNVQAKLPTIQGFSN